MWTQLCFRERYADGAGKTSVPVVVYVKALDEKGSIISGDLRDIDTRGVSAECGVREKGCEERRRIAWVIVGWKRPPWAE
jgi:hypothetical protein